MMNTPRSPQVALFERLPGKPLVEGSTCLFPAGRSSNTLSSPSRKRHQPPSHVPFRYKERCSSKA